MVTVLGLENDLDSLDLDAGASDSWSITGGSKTTAKSRSRSAADGKAALRKVARLIELFNEVDAAGSGQIRWDAFSEHFTGNSSSSSGGGGGGNLGASMAAAAGNISSSDDDDNDDDGDDDAGAAVDNETFAALTKAAKTKADKVKKIKEIERERDKENDGLRIWVKCSMIQSSI
jgi:hypothetical protein